MLHADFLKEGVPEALSGLIASAGSNNTMPKSTSVFLSKHTLSLTKIRAQYGVGHVLKGHIAKKEGQIHVTIQLLETQTGQEVYATTIELCLQNWMLTLYPVANELLAEIAGANPPVIVPIAPYKATQFYLQGQYHWRQQSYQAIKLAIGYFNKSIGEDPTFSLPYTKLAECYCTIGRLGYEASLPAFNLAKEYAAQSIELNGNRAAPYALAAQVALYQNKDLALAKGFLNKAFALSKNNAKTHHVMALYYLYNGGISQAEKHAGFALELEPFAMPYLARMVKIQIFRNRMEPAQKFLDIARKVDGTSPFLLECNGLVACWLGDTELAMEGYSVLQGRSNLQVNIGHGYLSLALSKTSCLEKAKTLEQRLQTAAWPDGSGIMEYVMALVNFGYGDLDGFYRHAKQAAASGMAILLEELQWNPIYEQIRSDLEFQELMRAYGLPANRQCSKEKKETSVVQLRCVTQDSLTLDPKDISFIEANDNYCTVYWYEAGTLKNKLLRVTLKKLEIQLATFDFIMRCHKTFMLNLLQNLFITGSARALFFESPIVPRRIPISRSKNKEAELRMQRYQ